MYTLVVRKLYVVYFLKSLKIGKQNVSDLRKYILTAETAKLVKIVKIN